jgi:predicted RND superfamily exporter protein
MLGAQIQFIYEFGIFVMITVSTSLLFSVFAFTSFMLILGPEGQTGSIKALVKKCCSCKRMHSENNREDKKEFPPGV